MSGLMFTLGLSMGQVFVPLQAAGFATIAPPAMGRASTMFNAVRQLGGAVGVALLTTAIVAVGPLHVVAGHLAPNLDAYRVAFLVAAGFSLLAIPAALTIRDSDAARTIPARRGRSGPAEPGRSGSAEPGRSGQSGPEDRQPTAVPD